MKRIFLGFILFTAVFTTGLIEAYAADVVVYTARKEHLVKPLFNEFTKETGINVKYLTGKDPVLLEKIKAEGANTPADIFMTVDAGNLWHAAQSGILQSVTSDKLDERIPSHLQDPDNRWFGLSIRARTIVYHADRVNPSELSTYAALADDKWQDRLCLRTSKKVYNQSLVASFIAEYGMEKTENIVGGWVENLATAPLSSDTKTIEAVLAGRCDVAIVNTYYLGRMQNKDANLPVKLFWADQNGNGTHVNISGAGIVKHSKDKENALRLLEWLTTDKAQKMLAEANFEYPVVEGVELDPIVAAWGDFKESKLNVSKLGSFQVEAIKLMDRKGYK